jgi:hypothetical protein
MPEPDAPPSSTADAAEVAVSIDQARRQRSAESAACASSAHRGSARLLLLSIGAALAPLRLRRC